MNEEHKECQECGWRGKAAELDETTDEPTGKTHAFCPNCGGTDIADLSADQK